MLSVIGFSSVTSSSPSLGSIYGGTVLTIQGNGFDSSTVVMIGNSVCTITSVLINQLTCETSAHTSASNISFQIR